jgi:hypothetical protein
MLTWGIVAIGCVNGVETPAGSAFGKDVIGGGGIWDGTMVCCPAIGAYEDGLVRKSFHSSKAAGDALRDVLTAPGLAGGNASFCWTGAPVLGSNCRSFAGVVI